MSVRLYHRAAASVRFTGLDVTSGKVTVGGDGNAQISFTSRPDIARYISYVLTHLPAEQLKDRSFTLAGDTKVRPFVYMLLFQHRLTMAE